MEITAQTNSSGIFRPEIRLPEVILAGVLTDLQEGLPKWKKIVRHSFLSDGRQDRYLEILKDRGHRLF